MTLESGYISSESIALRSGIGWSINRTPNGRYFVFTAHGGLACWGTEYMETLGRGLQIADFVWAVMNHKASNIVYSNQLLVNCQELMTPSEYQFVVELLAYGTITSPDGFLRKLPGFGAEPLVACSGVLGALVTMRFSDDQYTDTLSTLRGWAYGLPQSEADSLLSLRPQFYLKFDSWLETKTEPDPVLGWLHRERLETKKRLGELERRILERGGKF